MGGAIQINRARPRDTRTTRGNRVSDLLGSFLKRILIHEAQFI